MNENKKCRSLQGWRYDREKCLLAQKHMSKNRYSTWLAYDEFLPRMTDDTPYINATIIPLSVEKGSESLSLSKPYENLSIIATQAPLSNTIDDFWTMVWMNDIQFIVMLTNFEENGVEKSSYYFPIEDKKGSSGSDIQKKEQEEDSRVMCTRHYKITLDHVGCSLVGILRYFTITSFNENNQTECLSKRVVHLHVPWWIDATPPPSLDRFLDLLTTIMYIWKTKNHGPLVIHCSAGLGRTGVLSVGIQLYLTKTLKSLSTTDTVQKVIEYQRQFRPGLVFTDSQYEFLSTFQEHLFKYNADI